MRQRKVADDVREQVDSDLDSAGADVSRLFEAASRLLVAALGRGRLRRRAGRAPHRREAACGSWRSRPGKILVVQVNDPDVGDLAGARDRRRVHAGGARRAVRAPDARVRRADAARGPAPAARRAWRARSRQPRSHPRARARRSRAGRSRRRRPRTASSSTARRGSSRSPSSPTSLSLKKIFQAFDEKARVLDLVSRYLDSPGDERRSGLRGRPCR